MRLCDICILLSRGKTLPEKNKSKDGNFYNIRLVNIEKDGNVILDDKYKYFIENNSNLTYMYGSQNDDIIFSELYRNDLNVKLIKNLKQNNIIYSTRVIFARINRQLYNPQFLCNILNLPKYKERLEKEVYHISKGYEIHQLTMDNLKNFEIPDVPLEKQEEIIKQHNKLSNKINQMQNQIHSLYENLDI